MGNSIRCLRRVRKKELERVDDQKPSSIVVKFAPLVSPETFEDMVKGNSPRKPTTDRVMGHEEEIRAELNEPIADCPTEPVGTAVAKTAHVPIQRRFNYVPVNTVNFALPEGYSTSRSDIEFLGSGAYGNVIKTTVECRDGVVRAVAVKKFRDPFCDHLQARMIYREIKLLQIMRHDSVIRAIDLYTPNNVEHEFKDVYVVTEYAGDSIVKILHDQKVTGRTHITPEHVPFIIYQLLRALKYIHSANIIHRDLKPGNMALTCDSDLTVLDFGMARSLDRSETSLTQYVMTRWYRSPEVIYWNIDGYNEQVDLWSVGCITAELMLGKPLFPGEDTNAQYEMITKLCGSPDEDLMRKIEATSPATRRVVESYEQYKRQDFRQRFAGCPPLFIDFLDKILVLDPEKRLTVESSLAHPYFADYVDASDEPTATTSFDLNDTPSRSRDEWKGIIWQEIQNFVGDEISPKIPTYRES
ncbi:hypothetical protein KIN20_014704 [Parelaphostrongylus tenuis]|uniref:mitogen-activated protein kinase n=1 Tax=Parelaphostrongylus tenuis TaxID=148309 RepID=A0AAD5N3J1_PARTN|nr:hypothetical protein KIN20_014704 [Parelaphostrongylus tenuis]